VPQSVLGETAHHLLCAQRLGGMHHHAVEGARPPARFVEQHIIRLAGQGHGFGVQRDQLGDAGGDELARGAQDIRGTEDVQIGVVHSFYHAPSAARLSHPAFSSRSTSAARRRLRLLN
ncbi:hypothetical protein CW670_11950, partial [Macrococcoides caseolyticum]